MSSKFFNNNPQNTLFDKFKGIAQGMPNFYSFLAVVGYFRSSGYFKLRKELNNVQDIKILVGINVDSIFHKHNQALLMLEGNPCLNAGQSIASITDASTCPFI